MSIFAKPVSELEPDDLQQLVLSNAVENIRLEFKSRVLDKDETLKKISSFANSFGGFLVIGAAANSDNGRIESLPGVDEQPGFKQKIVQWCFDAVTPPVLAEVSDPIPVSTSGKFIYVIYIPESDLAPHFLNGRKGVWVRTDEFSQRYEPKLATENELLHLLDRRKQVHERRAELIRRSRRRFESYRAHQPSATSGAVNSPAPAWLEFSIGPRFPSRPVCDHESLTTAMKSLRIAWRQTTFPFNRANFISQHESSLFLVPRDSRNRVSFIEATVWGTLFYGTELEIDINENRTPTGQALSFSGIHLYSVVGYLLAFAEHANQTFSRIGYVGPLSINISLSSIRGVRWIYSEDGLGVYEGPMSELDDEFSFLLDTTTEGLKEQRDDLVLQALKYILFGTNWSDYAGSSDRLQELLRSGYKYNFWS